MPTRSHSFNKSAEQKEHKEYKVEIGFSSFGVERQYLSNAVGEGWSVYDGKRQSFNENKNITASNPLLTPLWHNATSTCAEEDLKTIQNQFDIKVCGWRENMKNWM